MDNQSIGLRIIKLRKDKRMTLEEVKSKMSSNISVQALSQMERGINASYNAEVLWDLANILDTTIGYLLSGGSQKNTIPKLDAKYIVDHIDNIDSLTSIVTIYSSYARPGVFALDLDSDSVSDKIPSGSIITVDSNIKTPTNGSVLVLLDKSTNSLIYREVYIDGGSIYLVSANSKLPHGELDDNYLVIGSVLEATIKM